MKILITGANGLLGRKLIDLFRTIPEIRCIATSRGKNRFVIKNDNVSYEELDITNPLTSKSILKKHEPDVVINAAAITQVDTCHENKKLCLRTNFEGVNNLLNGISSPDCHFIQLSTDFVFDGKDGPYDENAMPNPVNYYGECKLKAEQLVLGSGIHSAIVRTILVYGYSSGLSRSNLILWVKENLEKKKKIKVVCDQVRTPTLVEDLARGCWLMSNTRRKGIFNIGGPETLSPWDMAIKTAEYFRLDPGLIEKVNASTFSQPAKRPLVTGLIINKAKEILDYQPHSFTEGIKILDEQINSC